MIFSTSFGKLLSIYANISGNFCVPLSLILSLVHVQSPCFSTSPILRYISLRFTIRWKSLEWRPSTLVLPDLFWPLLLFFLVYFFIPLLRGSRLSCHSAIQICLLDSNSLVWNDFEGNVKVVQYSYSDEPRHELIIKTWKAYKSSWFLNAWLFELWPLQGTTHRRIGAG